MANLFGLLFLLLSCYDEEIILRKWTYCDGGNLHTQAGCCEAMTV